MLDISFRYDGAKIAMSLDKTGYSLAYFIVVFNADGTLYGSYRESTLVRGKANITSLLFDSSNFITAALDIS